MFIHHCHPEYPCQWKEGGVQKVRGKLKFFLKNCFPFEVSNLWWWFALLTGTRCSLLWDCCKETEMWCRCRNHRHGWCPRLWRCLPHAKLGYACLPPSWCPWLQQCLGGLARTSSFLPRLRQLYSRLGKSWETSILSVTTRTNGSLYGRRSRIWVWWIGHLPLKRPLNRPSNRPPQSATLPLMLVSSNQPPLMPRKGS